MRKEGSNEADVAGVAGVGWLDGEVLLLAAIWATVDLERTLRTLGLDPAGAAAAVEDPLLGARVIVVDGPPAVGPGAGPLRGAPPPIILAEPSSEGRLAATLARHDEGRAGSYIVAPVPLDEVRLRAAAAGVGLSRIEAGPFGPEVLVLDGPPTGPSTILVEPAAVPSPP